MLSLLLVSLLSNSISGTTFTDNLLGTMDLVFGEVDR